MRALLSIGLIVATLLSAEVWMPLLLDYPAVLEFALSDGFWSAALGMALGLGSIAAAIMASFVFHPGSLPGRRPEGGE